MQSKYHLSLCELHCSEIHGGSDMGHYLVVGIFDSIEPDTDGDDDDDTDDDEDNEDGDEETDTDILGVAEWYNSNYAIMSAVSHTFIRNYSNIIRQNNYVKPEIVDIVVLESGETTAILKTFWIRIFQRKWKQIFAKRMRTMKNILNILNRRLR